MRGASAVCVVVTAVALAAVTSSAPHYRMLHRMPDRMPDHMLDRMPDRMPDHMPDHMMDRMPDRMPDHMPDRSLDRISDRMPDRMPNRMSHRVPDHTKDNTPYHTINASETHRGHKDPSTNHKVAHHQKTGRNIAPHHHKRNLPEKLSTWKRITDTLGQAFLKYAGDDYDDDRSSSSDSDSDSESKSASRKNQQASKHKHSHLAAMARSALYQLGFANLPKLWRKKKRRRKARSRKSVAKRAFEKAVINKNTTEKEEQNVKEYGNGELAVEEGVPVVKQIYKIAGKSDVIMNPLSSLREIEREVEASGRKLNLIECVAMFEVMALALIAAGVFRSANLPVPIPLFAKI